MVPSTSHFLRGVLWLAALGLTASPAPAQQVNLNLPVEAHWGKVTLPPGHYQISIPRRSSSPSILEVHSGGKTISIMAGSETSRPLSDRCSLLLLQTDGAYIVREFRWGFSGEVFTFPLPKGSSQAAGLRKAQSIQWPLGS